MELNNTYKELHDINIREEYTHNYSSRYIAEIRHSGLGLVRFLKDSDLYMLNIKIDEQFNKWDQLWKNKQERHKLLSDKELGLHNAEDRTSEAQALQFEIENILLSTLDFDDTVDWNILKDHKEFSVPNPKDNLRRELKQVKLPEKPTLGELPIEPIRDNYKPVFTFKDKLFKSSAAIKIKQMEDLFELDLTNYRTNLFIIQERYRKAIIEYQKQIDDYDVTRKNIIEKFSLLEKEWIELKETFLEKQQDHNEKIDQMKLSYMSLNRESVEEYCELVLNNSRYPEFISKNFDLEYNTDSRVLIIEYFLPAPEDMPTLTEVKYIASKNEYKETHLSETQKYKLYDNTIYRIILRTLHELFEADAANAIDLISFNGWVETINKATGKKVTNCIVSIQTKKNEFIDIDLSQVDPKACFKNLKGIGSSKLSGITPVQPIAQITKLDKRFVPSYEVASALNEGYNLASMDWEDFEHLLREIFESEFSSNGGEVKVTQASRDGGVDAVAFDPDPIRGGKIVIQAKRYTNTVSVSAVRDLYGTVMNEGATKGILVTTADFGPDAYDFAKNKPLTLMNGANLLYLLEKHGHKAHIDLAQAKKMQSEK